MNFQTYTGPGRMRSAVVISLTLVLTSLLPWTQAAIQVSSCCDCNSLMPDPVADGTSPQIMPSPFVIKVSKSTYNPKDGTAEELQGIVRVSYVQRVVLGLID